VPSVLITPDALDAQSIVPQTVGEQTQVVELSIGKVILSLKYPHLNLLPEYPTSTSASVYEPSDPVSNRKLP
jgi:hypothetical protein